jgi:hypothetical protein
LIAHPINKSMNRDDLLTPDGLPFVTRLNELAHELEQKHLPVTSWYGGLSRPPLEFSIAGMRSLARRLLGRTRRVGAIAEIGTDQNRGIYLYKRKGHLPRAGVLRELENLKSFGN